jgi:hypothetical protein
LEEFDHFLGDPDVLHAVALVMGISAIGLGKRLPQLLAAVAATSLGLYVGLVIQDRQRFNEPAFGEVEIPQGVWFPVVAGLLSAAAAGALTYLTWRTALVLLTGSIVMLIGLAVCRLFEVSPERIFQLGASLLSAYRVVGAIVLILAILASVLLVRKFHKSMVSFASANLGTLLLLSGVSYFAQKAGAEAPFSLLDDMARIVSEVRGGRCQLWEDGGPTTAAPRLLQEQAGGDPGLEGCECQAQCRTEILAWICSTITVLLGRYLLWRYKETKEQREKRKKKEKEEKEPLAANADSYTDATPAASVIGKNQA